MKKGDSISLSVSLGNTLVALPDVVKQPEAAATAALTQAGLKVAITRPYDEAAPAGTVMAVQAPVNADGQLPRGSTVNVQISAGPAPRVVPNVVGEDVDLAKSQLDAKQLGISITQQYSNTVPTGQVMSADQAANAQVPRGTVVHVVVSQGPAPVPIPNVAGMSVSDASNTLQNAGFGVSSVLGSPLKKVIATDPPAGEAHVPGTQVRLFTRS